MIDIYIDLLEDLREIASTHRAEYAEEQKVVAPQWMKMAVQKGKKIRDSQSPSNKCCTDVGLRRASQIENGETLSLSTLKRMKSFVARHSGQADWGEPNSKRAQALLLWGVPYSKQGAEKFIKWVDSKISALEKDD